MALKTYITSQGEMLDQIARKIYGSEQGNTEALLAANPGLAALGPVYPEGIVINLPDVAPVATQRTDTISLWG